MQHVVEITHTRQYDVVVCGGGFTGAAAAVSAARSGKKTLLIEKGGCLGGTGTAGGVSCLLGGMDYENGEYRFVAGGIFKELYYRLRKTDSCVDVYGVDRNRSPHAWSAGLAESIIFDKEAMKRELDELVLSAGADIVYFATVFALRAGEDCLEYVLYSAKSGITAVEADVFIDCTGDADIAYMAGAKTIKGRPEDNLMMPATLIMNIENVDTEAILDYISAHNSPRFRTLIKDLRDKGEWPFPFDIFISMLMEREGYHMANTLRQVGIDGTDETSLTRGMIEGRVENKKLFDIIQKRFPGYTRASIAATAETIGIRETRRIQGNFMLSYDDLLQGTDFDDVIALSAYCFDIPDPKKPSYQPLEGQKTKKRYTEIPYRCLLPDTLNNLIVAGRSISIEREVSGPARVMGPCIGIGHAAGTAAAIAAGSRSVHTMDVQDLRGKLRSQDCIIDESDVCVVEK